MPRPKLEARTYDVIGEGTLSLITSAIGGRAGIRMLPSDNWGVDGEGHVLFPREILANTVAGIALRNVFDNVGHILYSGDPNVWTTIHVIRRQLARKLKINVGTALPFELWRILERERVERVQRREYRGLHTLIPDGRHQGWTSAESPVALATFAINTILRSDSRPDDPEEVRQIADALRDIDLEPYVDAKTHEEALRNLGPIVIAIVERLFNQEPPPEEQPQQQAAGNQDQNDQDAQSDQSQAGQPGDESDASSQSGPSDDPDQGDQGSQDPQGDQEGQNQDDAEGSTGSSPAGHGDNQNDTSPGDPQGTGNGAGQAGQPSSASDAQGQGDSTGTDDRANASPAGAADSSKPQAGADAPQSGQNGPRNARAPVGGTRCGPEHILDASNLNQDLPNAGEAQLGTLLDQMDPKAAEAAKKAGSGKGRTASNVLEDCVDEDLAGILKTSFEQVLPPSRRNALQPYRSGPRLLLPQAIRTDMKPEGTSPNDCVFGRRTQLKGRRYRLAAMLDLSGSMGTQRTSPRGLGAILTCTIARTLRDFPDIEFGVWGFDSEIIPIAPFGRHIHETDLLEIGGKLMSAGGGGTDAALALAALREAHETPGNGSDLFFLISDGDWTLEGAIQDEVNALIDDGGEIAVLLVGASENNLREAANCIGSDRVDQITKEEDLPEIIKRHLERMLETVPGARAS